MNAVVTKKRCAVYTRVSTDERLDQSFNSLDAQREAGQAYIVSQRAEGCLPVGDDYDDGGCVFAAAAGPALHTAYFVRHGGRHHAGGQRVEPFAARH